MVRNIVSKSLQHKIMLSIMWLFVLIVAGFAASTASAQVDDETCMACHDGYDLGLKGTTHQLSAEMESADIQLACISCHSGADIHIDDPNIDNIGNPSRMETHQVVATCSQCHQPHTETGTLGFDPHIGYDLSCTSCHQIHSVTESLLLDDKAAFCGQCHVSTTTRFGSRSNHPLESGNLTCISCHDFKSQNEPRFGHGGSVNCAECHQDVAGPYLFEHQAVSSFATEGEGCIACHAPHGSPNDRLLVQPDDGLCRQCHGLPPGHVTTHGGIGQQYGCVECHSAIHGSNDNRALLDDFLGTKLSGSPTGCDCHNVSN
jgi:DmsE family decaheme c-type cytochrome